MPSTAPRRMEFGCSACQRACLRKLSGPKGQMRSQVSAYLRGAMNANTPPPTSNIAKNILSLFAHMTPYPLLDLLRLFLHPLDPLSPPLGCLERLRVVAPVSPYPAVFELEDHHEVS